MKNDSHCLVGHYCQQSAGHFCGHQTQFVGGKPDKKKKHIKFTLKDKTKQSKTPQCHVQSCSSVRL